MPDPANQILALSSGVDRLSVELSVANLLSCHRINSAYLCERHGVLRRQLNTTCLGSLYIQDFDGAMTLCEMRLKIFAFFRETFRSLESLQLFDVFEYPA